MHNGLSTEDRHANPNLWLTDVFGVNIDRYASKAV